jgi:hypothetical protein
MRTIEQAKITPRKSESIAEVYCRAKGIEFVEECSKLMRGSRRRSPTFCYIALRKDKIS